MKDQVLVQCLLKTIMYYILFVKPNKQDPQIEKLYNIKFEYFQMITIIAVEVILNRMILINSMAQVLLLGRMEKSYIFNMLVVIEYLQIVLLKPLKNL